MIKQDELKKIQEKYKNLENELNQSVNDKDKYVSLSKEYADLKPLYDQVNLYLAHQSEFCLLYTSPSPRDRTRSRMPSSA